MKGAFRFPIIKIEGGSNPDPAIYCPANGYLPPYEYFESPIEVETVSNESIVFILDTNLNALLNNWIVYSDITSPKKFSFYDENGNLLQEQTTATNTNYTISQTIPESPTQFVKCILTLTNASSVISKFYSGASANCIGTVAVYINAPNLTSAMNFRYQKSLKIALILSTLNYVTNIDYLLASSGVEKFVLPVNLPALTSAQYMLTSSDVREFIFPTGFSAPLLTSMFYLTTAQTLNLEVLSIPDLPSLQLINLLCYNAPNLKTLVITGCSSVTSINQILQGCVNMEVVELPSFPALVNADNICNGMIRVKKITLNGTWGKIGTSPFDNNSALEELHYPRIVNSAMNVSSLSNTLISLRTIHVPDYVNDTAANWSRFANMGTYSNAVKKVYGDFEFASGFADLWYDSGYYNLLLEEINFPKLKVNYVRLGDNGTTNKMRKLSKVVVDWANSFTSVIGYIKIAAPLTSAQLDEIFTILSTPYAGSYIDVFYCDGYAGSNPSIAEAKGWIIYGTPKLTTNSVTSITKTTAASGGNITQSNGSTVSARGVCWSTSPNPTIANSKTSNGTGTGSFTSSITGLTANTTYYVRAYATNGYGTGYGQEISFTTLP